MPEPAFQSLTVTGNIQLQLYSCISKILKKDSLRDIRYMFLEYKN